MAVVAVAYLSIAVPALAADAAPKPGCAGLAFEDKAGDSTSGDKEVDVIAGWFDQADGKTYANLQMANADPDYTGAGIATGAVYYMTFKVGGALRYVQANVDILAGTSYEYGTYDDATGSYSPDGTTKGKFFSGANGVIQLEVPASIAKEGAVLGKPAAAIYNAESIPAVVGILSSEDTSSGGTDYTVGPCAGGGGGAAGTLAVTVAGKPVKAKSANKAKKATFTLTSTEAVSNITGTLKSGAKAVGTGKLASLNGTGKLSVKLKKKLKKGTYTLELSGTGADGTAGTTTSSVTVK